MFDLLKRNLIKEFGGVFEENLVKDICCGESGKFNGDNLDIRVNINDIRMFNKDKYYYFFVLNFVLDRIFLVFFNNIERLVVFEDVSRFIFSEFEVEIYKDSLKVFLGRIMVEYILEF